MNDKEEEQTTAPVGDGTGQGVRTEGPRQTVTDDGDSADLQESDDSETDPQSLSPQAPDSELEMARAEIERLQDQALRRQAELINFRRRVQREQAESGAVAQARLLEGLVPVIDDFERAVDAESGDARAYHEGMKLILRRVQKVLEEIGVERLEPRGEAFDPRYHEAIARHQTDEAPEGQILDVYQPGYRLNGRLIRPAAVVVAYGGEASVESPEPEFPESAEDVAVADDDAGRDDG